VNDFAGVLDCAANADCSFCRSTPWQAGQLGDWPSRVRYSKRFPQARHSYSKRGMRYSSAPIRNAVPNPHSALRSRTAFTALVVCFSMFYTLGLALFVTIHPLF
jgi:hypothetical protein